MTEVRFVVCVLCCNILCFDFLPGSDPDSSPCLRLVEEEAFAELPLLVIQRVNAERERCLLLCEARRNRNWAIRVARGAS